MMDIKHNNQHNAPIYSVDNQHRGICDLLSQTYLTNQHFERLYVEDVSFQGVYSKTSAEGLKLNVIDMDIKQDILLAGNEFNEDYLFGITCFFDGNMAWISPNGSKVSYAKGDMLVSHKRPTGLCQMVSGQKVRCVELAISTNNTMLSHEMLSYIDSYVHEAIISHRVLSVVHDILENCPRESLQQIYYYGKMHELFALVIDAIYEAEENFKKANLSEDWTKRLALAKKIIDMNIAEAPSISELARMVSLNETKLKIGLRKIFGMPVHSYIIDQRLQHSMLFLQSGKYNVTEAANIVGYSELGRFAVAFKKKFGVSPSKIISLNK